MASPILPSVLCIVLFCSADAAQNYEVVSACPRDENSWNAEAAKKKCQDPTPDYLCAAMENWVGHFGEICTKYGLSPAGKCAVLNNQTYNLDSVDCKAPANCPDQPYSPGELWKYQICYQDFYGTTTTPAITTTKVMLTAPPMSSNKTQPERPDDGGGSGGGGAVIAVVVVVILIIIGVIVALLMYRRNQWGFRDKVTDWRKRLPFCGDQETTGEPITDVEKEGGSNETNALLSQGEEKQKKEDLPMYSKVIKKDKSKKTDKAGNEKSSAESDEQRHVDADDAVFMKKRIEKLNILQRFLVHILKKEIPVMDLKEKSIIHSKSLKEHFSEPLLKDLQEVNDVKDYNNLDMSLVFALLRNFCPNIKPPTKGWDYEPPPEEETVGADVERIRQMWNKYCDNNSEFKYLDDVFNRMKQKYGTVAVEESDDKSSGDMEGFEDVKVKIASIKLNPDCAVERGIVITEGVKIALQLLASKNVVICRGAIGCGKTHALRAIQRNYEEKGWKTKWVEETLLLDEIHDEKTLVVCDNMFGSLGCNMFSSNEISEIENLLEKLAENPGRNIKVVIGIHQHVLDEVKKNNQMKFLQNKNITVDLDKQSEAETLLIFREQQKMGPGQQDSDSWFRKIDFASVKAKLALNQGHIGSPFLSLMYCCQPELFTDESFTKTPLENLSARFQRMKTEPSKLYYSLIYLMCVRKHICGNKLEDFAGQIEGHLTLDSVEKTIRETPGYFRADSGTVTLAHEVLTIALFKTVADVEEVLRPVYQNCEIQTILQLTRPVGELQSEFACGFVYPQQKKSNAREIVKVFVKRCADSVLDGEKLFSIDHPLYKLKPFSDRYLKYLKKK